MIKRSSASTASALHSTSQDHSHHDHDHDHRHEPTLPPVADIPLEELSVPLPLASPPSQTVVDDGEGNDTPRLDRIALLCLAVQHISASWNHRSAEFAIPLFFAALFPGTLLPASIYGVCLLLASLFLSPYLGKLVDQFKTKRLNTVRGFILSQKTATSIAYAVFLVLHSLGWSDLQEKKRWAAFPGLILIGIVISLSGTGMTISVERDWVTTIAKGQQDDLTTLNTIIRRIDLLSKLLAPLFVSLLTSTISYRLATVVLLAVCAGTLGFEWYWIGVVYRRFYQLKADELREEQRRAALAATVETTSRSRSARGRLRRLASHFSYQSIATQAIEMRRASIAFGRLSTFPTSVSLALLYTSVLSFDSTFLTYLKQPHPSTLSLTAKSNGILIVSPPELPSGRHPMVNYTDAFISGMRGLCVVFGLLGTYIMPMLSQRIGLVRLGSWSLFEEFFCLAPTLMALWIGIGQRWNTAILFTGMALSRVGLWSYDLSQLQLFQGVLYEHPEASLHFGMQQSLISLFDLSHYVLTLVWNDPKDFSRPASLSWGLIGFSWCIYVGFYVKRERGHVVHLGDGWRKLTSGDKRTQPVVVRACGC